MSNDNIKLTTPVGEFTYCLLCNPHQEYGDYMVYLALTKDEAKSIQETIRDEIRAQATTKPKTDAAGDMHYGKPPFWNEVDVDLVETGRVVFKAKMRAHVQPASGDSWDQHPDLYDAKGDIIPFKSINPWSGTRGRLSLELNPYTHSQQGVGVSLRLKGVQITELKEGGERDAKSHGFGETEGYVAGDHPAETNGSPFDGGTPREDLPPDEDDLPF